jgi:hypothetical protein
VIKKSKFSLLIICVLAFAVAVYFFLYVNKKGNLNGNGEGLSHFRVEAFQKETGWAYRIYQDSTAVIEQIYIPGVSGTTGFQTEPQALATGELVKKKLDMGIFPPSISQRELDSLGVRY